MDPIRKLFAGTKTARARGYGPSRFSYNHPEGRCMHCEGRGATLVEMHFLSDVWVSCEHCGGRRFPRETLEIRWKDHSIADVLDLPADRALELFGNQRALKRRLQALVDVGLGYLRLGQPASELSGGEAQRIKLARRLWAPTHGPRCCFLLDEPTTGLHFDDVLRLLEVLHRLVDEGHTAIVIEHHLEVIASADHVLDLGPEGGAAGGAIVAHGTPRQIMAIPQSHTGQALRSLAAEIL
jgi:excinuclease ABC subunit A